MLWNLFLTGYLGELAATPPFSLLRNTCKKSIVSASSGVRPLGVQYWRGPVDTPYRSARNSWTVVTRERSCAATMHAKPLTAISQAAKWNTSYTVYAPD